MLNPKKISARQVMNADVQTLHEASPIKEAILTLREYNITGAPVVNDSGECIGVFSSTDVLELDAETEERETPVAGSYFNVDPLEEETEGYFSREEYDLNVLGRDTVGQRMNSQIQAAAPDSSLERVCQSMLNERIHRVLVMEDRKLLGIISSFDVVRFVAGEASQKLPRPGNKKSGASQA